MIEKIRMLALLAIVTATLSGCEPTHITIDEESSTVDSNSVVYETPVDEESD
ncbi:MAG: hypothetical protein K6B38_13590 [Ruminococcus sp.]|jgi:hypothetical protein|nr:hypothetical protein [Ruminococcus sp.]